MDRRTSGPSRVVAADAFVEDWQSGGWLPVAGSDGSIKSSVAAIIGRVRREGQGALLGLTAQYDGVELDRLAVAPGDLAKWAAACAPPLRDALEAAGRRIEAFAAEAASSLGVRLAAVNPASPLGVTEAWLPLDSVGLYVPGGRAPYPSSVLMTALPARAAGVREIVLCTPPRSDGSLDPAVAAAAMIAGVQRVFRIGGAQAIAAMALGAGEVPRVAKIAGPGNAYVTEAKRQLYGECGFDGLAGPSEVVAVGGRPGVERAVAWQMLAQAEHGPDSLALGILLPGVAVDRVLSELQRGLAMLPPAAARTASVALAARGGVIVARDVEQVVQVVRAVRPEHVWVELATAPAGRRLAVELAQFAGAVYVGAGSPVAAGDYAAGPSHVLPTGGSARWGSPLGPSDFMRRVSLIELAPSAARTVAATASVIAVAEGFLAHDASLRVGGEGDDGGMSDGRD